MSSIDATFYVDLVSDTAPSWFIVLCGVVLGLIVGSFLNVLIYRLPRMSTTLFRREAYRLIYVKPPNGQLNLFTPRSHCPSCKGLIQLPFLVPILGWVLARGKCSRCNVRIPIRYPLVEAASVILLLLVFAVHSVTWQSMALVLATWMLLALATTDIETGTLPDSLNYALLWCGLVSAVVVPGPLLPTIESAVMGAVLGYVLYWILATAFERLTGRTGIGQGDLKLAAALGAWTGWELLPIVVIVGSVAATFVVIVLALQGKYDRRRGIGYGPFLALGALVTFLLRPQLVALLVQ